MKKTFLYRHKVIKFIELINNNHPLIILELSKKSDLTQSHVTGIINILVKGGIVIREKKDGRSKNILLTEKGKKLQNNILRIKEIMEEK